MNIPQHKKVEYVKGPIRPTGSKKTNGNSTKAGVFRNSVFLYKESNIF